jgi:hypothetical protein
MKKTLIIAIAIMLTGCPAESKPYPDAPQYMHEGRTQVIYVKDENNHRVCFGIFGGSLNNVWGTAMVPCNMLSKQPTVLVKSTTRP